MRSFTPAVIYRKATSLLRSLVVTVAVSIGFILFVEFAGWMLSPGRYRDPPPVTADAWIYSDAVAPQDTVWLKEFVDEFCRSYSAHWTSYVYFKRNPFTGKHINVDTNGIRYTPSWRIHVTRTDRPVRILLFGGSTMWGTGARDSGTIPSALSRLIASDPELGKVAVVNMGESGYVSTQEVIRLELELRKGNVPDVVILYDGVNDIFSAYQNAEAGLPQNEMNRAMEFNLLKDGGRMRRLGLDDLLKRTVTASVVSSIRSAIAASPPPAPSHIELAGDIVRLYRGNLEMLQALSKEYGFCYEAFWQPVVFGKKTLSSYEQGQSDKERDVRPLFLEAYRRVKEDSVLRMNSRFHDISEIFDGTGLPVYLDFCHITETANALVARKMYAEVRDTLLRREKIGIW